MKIIYNDENQELTFKWNDENLIIPKFTFSGHEHTVEIKTLEILKLIKKLIHHFNLE
jgi:hypothetical protein